MAVGVLEKTCQRMSPSVFGAVPLLYNRRHPDTRGKAHKKRRIRVTFMVCVRISIYMRILL